MGNISYRVIFYQFGENALNAPDPGAYGGGHARRDFLHKIVSHTTRSIIEVGARDGAPTVPMERLGRPLTAIEIDRRRAERLAHRTTTHVVTADFLRYRLPPTPHVVVGNLPFHLTTTILRRLLHSPGWTDAVLLVQWEVARRRAAVGDGNH